jgi:hypothetical protein
MGRTWGRSTVSENTSEKHEYQVGLFTSRLAAIRESRAMRRGTARFARFQQSVAIEMTPQSCDDLRASNPTSAGHRVVEPGGSNPPLEMPIKNPALSRIFYWRPQGDSNPRTHRERVMS